MPIISRLESRTLTGRLMHAAIILALTLGGLTMLYPFAVMVSGSVRSEMDIADFNLVPRYLVDRDSLFRKFLETKYNQDVLALNRSHRAENFSFRDAAVPDRTITAAAEDMETFLASSTIPRHWVMLGGIQGVKTQPDNLRQLRDNLADRFKGDIGELNRKTGAPLQQWSEVILRPPDWLSPRYDYADDPVFAEYQAMQAAAPRAELAAVSLSGHFLQTMIYPQYGQRTTAAYNVAHKTPVNSFSEFTLPRSLPGDDPMLAKEWQEYVTRNLNPSFLTLTGVDQRKFADFLRSRYDTIDGLNAAWRSSYKSFAAIPLPAGEWLSGARRTDYRAFAATQAPATYRLVGPEYAWADWLSTKYGSIDSVNRAYGTDYASFDTVRMPIEQLERKWVDTNASAIRWSHVTRNFRMVGRELVGQGTVLRNTAIYCAGSVVLGLIINPLAAYGLSRFRLPGTFKFLLVMIVTMAFPAMVTLIPTFIMLRNLDLLNTFAALLLPAAANGYLIFMLKGFFDSLPREIYEAASLDGAGEMRLFFQFTLALSKPILAVVALIAFTHAYVSFLYALIVCPREDMWTLSVWLYQWQGTVSTSAVFASVLCSSLPILLMFLLTQRTIMRGLAVPSEK